MSTTQQKHDALAHELKIAKHQEQTLRDISQKLPKELIIKIFGHVVAQQVPELCSGDKQMVSIMTRTLLGRSHRFDPRMEGPDDVLYECMETALYETVLFVCPEHDRPFGPSVSIRLQHIALDINMDAFDEESFDRELRKLETKMSALKNLKTLLVRGHLPSLLELYKRDEPARLTGIRLWRVQDLLPREVKFSPTERLRSALCRAVEVLQDRGPGKLKSLQLYTHRAPVHQRYGAQARSRGPEILVSPRSRATGVLLTELCVWTEGTPGNKSEVSLHSCSLYNGLKFPWIRHEF